MPSSVARFRFAPSPTGFLHVGNARAALFNWLEARRIGGEFLLRVEDTDRERSRSELVDNILESLRWLGLDWDGPIVFQADRLEDHVDAAVGLLGSGRAYWCDCTADAVQERTGDGSGAAGYDGFCRDRGLARGEGTALRFRTPDTGRTSFTDLVKGELSFDHDTIEDFVLLRSNGTPVFLLSNALDDAAMGITHVVRGEDHVPGTPKYLLLRDALDLGRPEVFAHLPLLVNESRKKLSKRRDAVAVGDFRAAGYVPEAVRNYLATLGWGPGDDIEIRPIEEIIDLFRLGDVTPSPAFFDVKKLEHFNAEYLRALTPDAWVAAVRPFLSSPERSLAVIERLAPVLQERVRLLPEAEPMVDFLCQDDIEIDEASWAKAVAKAPEQSASLLDAAIAAFATLAWDAGAISEAVATIAGAHDLKLGKAQGPIRVAVTGRTVGPPLWESIEVLGRDRTLERLTTARRRLGD